MINNFENLDPEKLNDLKSTSSTIYIKLSSGILQQTKSAESPLVPEDTHMLSH